jgi:hypothetical protein
LRTEQIGSRALSLFLCGLPRETGIHFLCNPLSSHFVAFNLFRRAHGRFVVAQSKERRPGSAFARISGEGRQVKRQINRFFEPLRVATPSGPSAIRVHRPRA